MTSRQKAFFVADLARAKKAEDIVILDMRRLSNITDFFIIMSATSIRRAQTIAESIEKGLHRRKDPVSSIEGYHEARWILIDAYNVVAHIFNEAMRKFYNLEGLWSDAPRVKICRTKRKRRSRKSSRRK